MSSKDLNRLQLEIIAEALKPLLGEVVFVGGCTTVLLVDEAAHFGVRETKDVDVIVDVASRKEYYQLSDSLRKLGFREDADGPVCRWLFDGKSGLVKLDVMPINEDIIGFSNRWYKAAIAASNNVELLNGLIIKVINPVYFLATKFEAFSDRGKGSYFSHDMEDIIFVLENRENILIDLMQSPTDLKLYFCKQARSLLNDEFFNVLPGLLNNANSARAVENTLRIMSKWDK